MASNTASPVAAAEVYRAHVHLLQTPSEVMASPPSQVVGATTANSSEADRAFSHVAAAEVHRVRVRVSQVRDSFIIDVDPAVEVDTSRRKPGRFLNKKQFGMLIGISVAIVTQMHSSSEEQKIISLGLLAAVMAVSIMEHWVMTCKVNILGITLNFAKILCFYLLPCILRPEWLIWYGFVIAFMTAIAYTFYDEIKTKFT